MKKLFFSCTYLALATAYPVFAADGVNPTPVGVWEGLLMNQMKIVFNISETPGHNLTATLDSPDQKAYGIPVDKVVFDNGHLHMEATAISGTYDGQISADGTEIDGTWTQGRVLALNLKKTADQPSSTGPSAQVQKFLDNKKTIASEEPQKPYPYQEEQVTFTSSQEGVTLGGTLTLPKGTGPFPAAILIAGSGPNTRDEIVFGHHIFRVLADYLTRHGIAVLRYDKRGIGASTGDYGKATTEDFATDALAAVGYLKGRKEINSHSIGLIGHSEGGEIAPMVAAKSQDVAFIVLMAGPGVTGDKIIIAQGSLSLKSQGFSDQQIADNEKAVAAAFDEIRKGEDRETTLKKIRELEVATIHELAAGDPKKEQTLLSSAEAGEEFMLSPWFRFLIDYDPTTALVKVKCPVLAVNGEKDFQVPPQQNLPAIEAALKKGGNADYTVKVLPGLNHLFQNCKTGSTKEYADTALAPSPLALQTITGWVLKHVDPSQR